MKKEQELKEIYLVVIEKRKRWLKYIDESWYETCETAKEAKLFTAPGARDAVKLLADKHYVYGAKVVCSGEYNNAVAKAKKERLAGAGKTQEAAKGPENPAENVALPKDAPCNIPGVNAGESWRKIEAELDAKQAVRNASPYGGLTWVEVKNIVELADYEMGCHANKELLKMGEEGFYRLILEKLNAQ